MHARTGIRDNGRGRNIPSAAAGAPAEFGGRFSSIPAFSHCVMMEFFSGGALSQISEARSAMSMLPSEAAWAYISGAAKFIRRSLTLDSERQEESLAASTSKSECVAQ